MKKHGLKSLLAIFAGSAMLLAGGAAFAEGDRGKYVQNADGEIWRNASGDCWTHTSWTEADAIEECHPDLVQRPEPAPEPRTETRTETRVVTLEAGALFGFDSAELTNQGRNELRALAREVEDGARIDSMRVTGHTDRIGPAEYNQRLSERRANSVVEFLSGLSAFSGMDIQGRGMGETAPVVQCEDKPRDELIACLQPNRRVEVEIITSQEVEVQD